VNRSILLPLFAMAVLAACAEQPMVMDYFPGKHQEQKQEQQQKQPGSSVEDIVWPQPPDVPRYRYAGQLQGEGNFSPDEEHQPGAGEKFLRWLVGLAQSNTEPRQLVRPQSGMVGTDGRIYVTDVGYKAVFVFDADNGKLSIWDKADELGEFVSPIGIAPGIAGEILVADSVLARVVRLDSEGNPQGSIGADVLERPTGLAVDPATGNIYVADTLAHDIKYFDPNGQLIKTIGRRGTEPGEFNAPTFLCIAHGKLYVSDTLNTRVQILTLNGEPLDSIGQRGLYVGNLSRPKGITVDDEGNIYIVESFYDHLLVFNAEGEYLMSIGGSGGGLGDFFLPSGVWSDAQNRIFTADMFNGRIIIVQYLGE